MDGRLSWLLDFLKEELAPYEGRGTLVARMVVVATTAMIVISVVGLLTLNDLLAAIVGDISAGDDSVPPKTEKRSDGSWLLNGMLNPDTFHDLLGQPLVAPVVAQLGVEEVLVDRRQLSGQDVVEQLENGRIAMHGDRW